jgi:ADP-dependent NAD(P)H-hydrate dehydratase / NAD(P)H-hydrate epimerase
MKICSVEQMKQFEKNAVSHGLSIPMMMENAGIGIADHIIDNCGKDISSHVVIGLVGPGNNGGDVLVALKLLVEKGYKTVAFCYSRENNKDEQTSAYVESGGTALPAEKTVFKKLLDGTDNNKLLILDGLLGTGFHLPLKDDLKGFLNFIKNKIIDKNIEIIAIDCPSGVDCTSGEMDDATLKADATICMAAVKEGLLKFPGFEYTGTFRNVDIGLDTVIPGWDKELSTLISKEQVKRILPGRSNNSHKGTFGKVLVVGSSINYCGAVLLSAKAVYRSGSGLVTLGVTESVYNVIAGQLPEATWILLPGDMGDITEDATNILLNEFAKSDAVLLGPGLGVNNKTERFVLKLISSFQHRSVKKIGFIAQESNTETKLQVNQPPFIIDADALKCLAKIPEWWKLLSSSVVITPHPGEMSTLTSIPINEIQSNRLEVCQRFAKEWNKTIVLKGAMTVISDPKKGTSVLPIATSSLAHAGTGDVLSGMIASYVGQGITGYEASILACYLHAHSGLRAAKALGNEGAVMASDVVQEISMSLNDLEEKK